jgi:hypothetical protein
MASTDIGYYDVPPALSDHIAESRVPFYKPAAGHNPTADATYAVRANECYRDFPALYEGERAYVRQALLKAQEVIFHPAPGKNPILLIGNFAASPINVAESSFFRKRSGCSLTPKATTQNSTASPAQPQSCNTSLH